MSYSEWVDLAAQTVKVHVEQISGQTAAIDRANVLWAASILEIRRALVWYGEKLYMISYNTNTGASAVDTYIKEE